MKIEVDKTYKTVGGVEVTISDMLLSGNSLYNPDKNFISDDPSYRFCYWKEGGEGFMLGGVKLFSGDLVSEVITPSTSSTSPAAQIPVPVSAVDGHLFECANGTIVTLAYSAAQHLWFDPTILHVVWFQNGTSDIQGQHDPQWNLIKDLGLPARLCTTPSKLPLCAPVAGNVYMCANGSGPFEMYVSPSTARFYAMGFTTCTWDMSGHAYEPGSKRNPDYDLTKDLGPMTSISTPLRMVHQSFASMSTIAAREMYILSPENPPQKECECGSEKVGSPMHSSWCPKHE